MERTILKKKYGETNVMDATKERILYLMNTYDKVIVNFSGGKDSTAMLYMAIDVVKENNLPPVEVFYLDHEVEGRGTYNMIEEVAAMEHVDLKWYALPFSLRNAASMDYPLWYPYHPEEKDIWVSQPNEKCITQMEGHYFDYDKNYKHPDDLPFRAGGVTNALGFQEIADLNVNNYRRKGINAIALVGIRAEESPSRYSMMARKKTECYISSNIPVAYPIYDWLATDVWKHIKDTGLPYNHEYDLMNRTEHYNKLNKQRVGSVFAEESLRTLHQWREMYGDYWHDILFRAEGVKTAWRYGNDGIYSGTKIEKDPSISWSDYTQSLLTSMSKKNRKLVTVSIKRIVVWHSNQTDYPIAEGEKESCPLTGISWEFLARIAIRGDAKQRNLQRVPTLAMKARARAGITRDQAVAMYGSDKYKIRYNAKRTAS